MSVVGGGSAEKSIRRPSEKDTWCSIIRCRGGCGLLFTVYVLFPPMHIEQLNTLFWMQAAVYILASDLFPFIGFNVNSTLGTYHSQSPRRLIVSLEWIDFAEDSRVYPKPSN